MSSGNALRRYFRARPVKCGPVAKDSYLLPEAFVSTMVVVQGCVAKAVLTEPGLRNPARL